MDDKAMEKEHIRVMVGTIGWGIIKKYIEDKIQASSVRLLAVDPSDAGQVSKYQTTARSYKELLDHIKNLSE